MAEGQDIEVLPCYKPNHGTYTGNANLWRHHDSRWNHEKLGPVGLNKSIFGEVEGVEGGPAASMRMLIGGGLPELVG